MSATEIQLYKTFKGVFGENGAHITIEGIKYIVKNEFERSKELLATRQDIFFVRQEIADVKMELRKEIADAKDELRKEIADVKDTLRKEISNTKADLMKFMLVQTIAIIGVVVTLIKVL